jgi:predicted nucleic acid-binding protein
MTAYLDSSTILRRLMKQPGGLVEWRLVRTPISSRLTEVECLRTLDRLRVDRKYSEEDLVNLREGFHRILTTLEIVELSRSILVRAAQPSPIALGTLDAIHLCSALAWRERMRSNPVLGTHDAALAKAARAHGFRVVGA